MPKIECLLKREGGSKIELGDELYHFKPQADGTHVAEVKDTAHVERLLSIKEAYKLVANGNDKKADAEEKEKADHSIKTESSDSSNENNAKSNDLVESDSSSDDSKDALIAEAKSLNIPANKTWGIERLKKEIAALKAE